MTSDRVDSEVRLPEVGARATMRVDGGQRAGGIQRRRWIPDTLSHTLVSVPLVCNKVVWGSGIDPQGSALKCFIRKRFILP
eukprot:366421-Chlamydomonas_euryale.AAC.14